MGLGTSSCGLTVAGFGDATEVDAPPAPTQWVRRVDPATGDYEIDAETGNFRRMTPVRQRVLLSLATALGSSTAQQGWGIKRPRKINRSFASDLEQSARFALQPMVTDGSISIESVTVDTGFSRSRLIVTYRDLTTKQRAQETIPIG